MRFRLGTTDLVEDILELFEDLPLACEVGLQVIATVGGLDLGKGAFEGLEIGAGVFYVLWWKVSQ